MLSRLRELINQRRNRDTLYSTEAYWDAKADIYQDKAVSMWANNVLNDHYEREQKALINRYLDNIDGLKLLDVGCGTGRFSRWFASKGGQVTGVDFSSGALSIAKQQSPSGNPTYRHGSIFELTDENTYDVVFTWAVLTMACRNKAGLLDALTRLKRSLRSNGRLLLTEPIHRGFLHRVLNLDLPSFLAVMQEAGFEIKAITPLHFWPMRLVLAYIPWPAWITTPLYHLGQAAMKIPGLSKLGDYWAVLAYPIEPLSNPPSNKR